MILLGHHIHDVYPLFDHEGVVGLDGGCHVVCFDVGIGFHFYFDDSKEDLALEEVLK